MNNTNPTITLKRCYPVARSLDFEDELMVLIKKNRDLFASEDKDLGRRNTVRIKN